jgi:hypothetical protein
VIWQNGDIAHGYDKCGRVNYLRSNENRIASVEAEIGNGQNLTY